MDQPRYRIIKLCPGRSARPIVDYRMNENEEKRYREAIEYEKNHGCELMGELQSYAGSPMTVAVMRKIPEVRRDDVSGGGDRVVPDEHQGARQEDGKE